jgi:hypothetical protein
LLRKIHVIWAIKPPSAEFQRVRVSSLAADVAKVANEHLHRFDQPHNARLGNEAIQRVVVAESLLFEVYDEQCKV